MNIFVIYVEEFPNKYSTIVRYTLNKFLIQDEHFYKWRKFLEITVKISLIYTMNFVYIHEKSKKKREDRKEIIKKMSHRLFFNFMVSFSKSMNCFPKSLDFLLKIDELIFKIVEPFLNPWMFFSKYVNFFCFRARPGTYFLTKK